MSNLRSRANEIFLSALECSGDLDAYVASVCGENASLLERVQALLRAHREAGGFLQSAEAEGDDNPIPLAATRADFGPIEKGVMIDQYKLLEEIGSGGMGTVWLAEQAKPIKRKVAIKLIKAGMDSGQVLARFEAERQALAMMDHPNIARVLDGGITVRGRPYFAMEYVKGVPLTDYCDAAKLSVQERLELFVPICNAVQHAHQKGIVHRDLKPSNILVCLYDGRPIPKVIDFGLAKAMYGSLTDLSLYTSHGQMVGTPLYMSPEQAEHNNLDIDTRTDVYSLGVILYELLTGTTPLERSDLKAAAFNEMLRLIKEVDPPKPSTRLSGSKSLPSVAAQRSIAPSHLARSITGDLDWVVMKALEKERSRRYETASGFAEDIQRHLADEPVSASPPSTQYRIRKFVKRNRAGVLAATVVVSALLFGILGATTGLYWALDEKRIADEARAAEVVARQAAVNSANAEREAKDDAQIARNYAEQAAEEEKAAHDKARQRLDQIEKANAILGSVFENLDPDTIAKDARPLQAILLDQLDKAVAQLAGDSIGDSLVVAKMQTRLGKSLRALGAPEKAIPVLETALTTRKARLGVTHQDTLATQHCLCLAYESAGEMDKALPLMQATLDLARETFGDEHARTLMSLGALAKGHLHAGNNEKALRLAEEAFKRSKAKHGLRRAATLMYMGYVAAAYRAKGELAKAISIEEQRYELQKSELGPKHPKTLAIMSNLAVAYEESGQREKSLPLLEQTLEYRVATLGQRHPSTLNSMLNLGTVYRAMGDNEKAMAMLTETISLMRERLGVDHPMTLQAMNSLAMVYMESGHRKQAIALHEQTLKLRTAKLGANHPSTLTSMHNLAGAYAEDGQLHKSQAMLKSTLELRRSVLGAEHPSTTSTMEVLADVLEQADKQEVSRVLRQEIHSLRVELDGTSNPKTLVSLIRLIEICLVESRRDEVTKLTGELVQGLRRSLKAKSTQLLQSLAKCGEFYIEAGAYSEAQVLLTDCRATTRSHATKGWLEFRIQSLLGDALLGLKDYTPAEAHLLEAYRGMDTLPVANPREEEILQRAVRRLIRLYESTENAEEVENWKSVLAKRLRRIEAGRDRAPQGAMP